MTEDGNRRSRRVPQGRLGRLARLGGVAAGVSGRVALGAAGRLVRGQGVSLPDLLLTPANVGRLTDELARLRGAAMKVGQLVSMDAGGMLPPELAGIMARLRAGADAMPDGQLQAVLDGEWGQGWEARLAFFDRRPIAAASIGQVHEARTPDGRRLAVKVQYPGVRASINSDVDNVAALLRLTGLVPPAIDPAPLLAEAKRQLHEEADYRHEARCLEAFGRWLSGDADFLVPVLAPEFSTGSVLAMSFADGVPIETLETADRASRDRVAELLLGLALREFFGFGLVQTDPNFANYRFQPDTGRVVLLDFGASRAFAPAVVEKFRRLALAGLDGDRAGARAAMLDIGILEEGFPRIFQAAVTVVFETLFRAISADEFFDFADVRFVEDIRAQMESLSERREALRAPPADVLYLQRKAGGLFLLAVRLKARVPVARLLRERLDGPRVPA